MIKKKFISLKKWNCTRLTRYFRMLVHRCHNTTERSPAVFYFSSDCKSYMIVIWKSLTAGRYFSVLGNKKCIVVIHNPLPRDAQTSSESIQQSPQHTERNRPPTSHCSLWCAQHWWETITGSMKNLKLRSCLLNLIPDCN